MAQAPARRESNTASGECRSPKATRRLIDPEFVRTIMLITVRGRPHSPAVGAFVQAARTFKWPQSRFAPMPVDPEGCGPELEPAD